MKNILIALVVVIGLVPAVVSAQDKAVETRKLGLTFPNIGVIWHMTDHVAFAPDVSFNHNWSTFSSNSAPDDYSGNTVSVNAALRFYVQDWKGIRFYVTPKYGYGRTSLSIQYESGSQSTSRTADAHSITGAWGLQYAITDRISLFGDIGARYSRSTSEGDEAFLQSGTKNHTIGTVGTWGLIVYLK
jgi:opacity protein-like surface antigen